MSFEPGVPQSRMQQLRMCLQGLTTNYIQGKSNGGVYYEWDAQ